MKIHGKIQSFLAKEYKKKGFKVQIEAIILKKDGKFYRVDVLAEKGKHKIAVEIGRTQEKKLKELLKMGYEVRTIPFHTIREDKRIECICGYIWVPRVAAPLCCPKCKQYLCWSREEYFSDDRTN